VLSVSASPSSFLLHANDTRETKIVITNGAAAAVGMPSLDVVGLAHATFTFAHGTCTASLAPGESCTATGMLTATSAGQASFSVKATTSPGGRAMTPLTASILAA